MTQVYPSGVTLAELKEHFISKASVGLEGGYVRVGKSVAGVSRVGLSLFPLGLTREWRIYSPLLPEERKQSLINDLRYITTKGGSLTEQRQQIIEELSGREAIRAYEEDGAQLSFLLPVME